MRFMVIVKASKDSEAGKMPSEELLGAMAKFNEELVKAGVMVDGAGLQSSAKGARIKFSGDTRTVVRGPFPETSQLIAGYWIINVKSLDEAIDWMRRCPNPHEDEARSRSASISSWRTSATARRSSTTRRWARSSRSRSDARRAPSSS